MHVIFKFKLNDNVVVFLDIMSRYGSLFRRILILPKIRLVLPVPTKCR